MREELFNQVLEDVNKLSENHLGGIESIEDSDEIGKIIDNWKYEENKLFEFHNISRDEWNEALETYAYVNSLGNDITAEFDGSFAY